MKTTTRTDWTYWTARLALRTLACFVVVGLPAYGLAALLCPEYAVQISAGLTFLATAASR
jgi:hypothetical protein